MWRQRATAQARTGSTGRVVAVTGAAGRVGTACVRALVERGDDVIAIDRRIGSEPVLWQRVDLRRARPTRAVLAGVAHVIHLAGHTMPDPSLGSRVLLDNVAIATHVLDGIDAGVPSTVVIASSVCVYGLVFEPRVRSPRYVPVDEDHPCEPGDPYSLSKLVIEDLAAGWTRRTGSTSVCLRFPWTAGADRARVAGYVGMLATEPLCPQSRGNLWASVHVDDLADAFVRALDVDDGAAHVVNVASSWYPGDLPLSALVGQAHPSARVLPDIEEEGPFSTRRARALLGWAPRRTFASAGA